MKTISKTILGLISLCLIFFLFLPIFVKAFTDDNCKQANVDNPNKCASPDNSKCVPCTSNSEQTVKLDNPLGAGLTSPIQLYARIIYSFMGVTGVVALIMFIIGGFIWMTAGGNAEKVKKGMDTIMWAVFGIILIFASYAILRAIFETLRF